MSLIANDQVRKYVRQNKTKNLTHFADVLSVDNTSANILQNYLGS